MLSRIAESMFWIGRYVERAEDTARILDVQTQLMLEDATTDEEATCRGLLSIMGIEDEPAGPVTVALVLDALCYDPASPTSIAAALAAARESARRARETLSVPLWEAVNTTYRAIPSGQFQAMRAPGIFQWVRGRAALINGTADATTVRDEGWHFLMLGRCVERADMTSRLVASAAAARSSGSGQPWTSTLRACGAYEAFLRAYRGWRPSGTPQSSCCSTGSSRARWSSRSTGPSSAWRTSAPPSAPGSRTRRSGCSGGPAPSWSTAPWPT